MFSQLGDRLKETFRDLRGRGRLSEDGCTKRCAKPRSSPTRSGAYGGTPGGR